MHFCTPAYSLYGVMGVCWTLSQFSMGERHPGPWTGCQCMAGPHSSDYVEDKYQSFKALCSDRAGFFSFFVRKWVGIIEINVFCILFQK